MKWVVKLKGRVEKEVEGIRGLERVEGIKIWEGEEEEEEEEEEKGEIIKIRKKTRRKERGIKETRLPPKEASNKKVWARGWVKIELR